MKSILSVGMDVHKNSFSLCAYDGYTGEIVSESTFASDVKLVLRQEKGNPQLDRVD